MSYRFYGVGWHEDSPLVYDPCTGLTHRAPFVNLAEGRQLLDDATVRRWPVVQVHELSRPMPVSICWSPIVRCNLRCPHCLDDKSISDAAGIPWMQMARLIARAGLLGVDISGGEPLLIPELPQLLTGLIEGGVAVGITTNGWLLAERTSEIKDCVDAVRVSLDGPDADTHDHLRGPGSYVRAMEGLRAAVQRKICVQIHFVAMASTISRVQEMIDLASREGVYGITVLQMLPIGEGAFFGREELIEDEDLERFMAKLHIPLGLHVRHRLRKDAANFTVVRADGSVWRNNGSAHSINRIRLLSRPEDLTIDGFDGSS